MAELGKDGEPGEAEAGKLEKRESLKTKRARKAFSFSSVYGMGWR